MGSEAPLGEFDSDSHLLDMTFSGLGFADITAFGHWLDFEDAKEAISLATYGVRVGGNTSFSENVTVQYSVTFAHQVEHGENSSDISENFYSVACGVSWQGLTAKIGYEVLEGNGTVAFQTPLATKHKFQGFADVFLTTPADGLKDLNASLSFKSKPFSFLKKGITVVAAFHDFEGEDNSVDLGTEFDAALILPLPFNFKVVTKYADYDGKGFAADREKFMFGINYSF